MEFIYYFDNVFTFTNILILILGTIGGLLMGAAPWVKSNDGCRFTDPFYFSDVT